MLINLCAFLQAALYAAPYKSDFLKALSKGREVKEEDCLDKVRQFLVNFTATIDIIYDMYTKMNAELEYKAWAGVLLSDWLSSDWSVLWLERVSLRASLRHSFVFSIL